MHRRTAVRRRSPEFHIFEKIEVTDAFSSPTRVQDAKRQLRETQARVRREAHRGAGRAAATEIRKSFQRARTQGLILNPGDIVSAYWPLRDELDVSRLLAGLHDEGMICALPVVAAKASPLVFRRWRPGDELVSAGFGLAEPSSAAPVLDPRVLLVPLLAVDVAGNRLGYGAGYYDRTLAELRARGPVAVVGMAFEAQRVAALPVDGYDQPLDWLVTEQSVTRFKQ
jgi:5-formyltetrahydrofolate cyclo-ligase